MKVKAQTAPIACIILAAGKGTRMRSNLPKVMHEVARKPMLMHVIDSARSIKAEKIIVVTSPAMNSVNSLIKQNYKDKVEIAVQKEQKGTGDAVKSAMAALSNFNGIVLILYGDAPLIRAETLTHITETFKADPALSLIVLGMETSKANEYGRLVLDKKGDLERIVETKDATTKEKTITLCNSGVMAVRSKILAPLLNKLTNKNAKSEYYLTDLVGLARKDKQRCGVVTADINELMGINSRSELAIAEATLQERLRNKAMENGVTLIDPASVYFSADTKLGQDIIIYPHVVFGPHVEIGDHVEIHSFCHIEGAKIRSKVTVGPFARLRPGAVLNDSAHIGNFVEIKNTIVERGAKVNHLSYVGDAVVGENANVGAGTITCNYDGYNKHRTVIGAGSFIGSNSSLVAPVIIGDGAIIGAGSVITEDVDADALAISRAPQKQKHHWAKTFRNRKNN